MQACHPSLLTGKLFDETGDRMSPSHSKKNGKRMRYYISYRLSKQTGEKDIAGWRLPATPLEDQITQAVMSYIRDKVALNLFVNPDAMMISHAMEAINNIDTKPDKVAALINRIDIAPGRVTITLDVEQIAVFFNIKEATINAEVLTFKPPFQTRKRGVETKFLIGHVAAETDSTLIRNLAMAHKWLGMIKTGKSLDDIAVQDNTSRRRIPQIIAFAFLAPDLVQLILDGHQPIGLTSEWVLRHAVPDNWPDQRALITTL